MRRGLQLCPGWRHSLGRQRQCVAASLEEAPLWVGSKSGKPRTFQFTLCSRACGSGCELSASCSSDCCHSFLTTMASPSAAISQNKLSLASGPGDSGEQQKSDRYTWVPGSKLKRQAALVSHIAWNSQYNPCWPESAAIY